jgi:hypothetical protein
MARRCQVREGSLCRRSTASTPPPTGALLSEWCQNGAQPQSVTAGPMGGRPIYKQNHPLSNSLGHSNYVVPTMVCYVPATPCCAFRNSQGRASLIWHHPAQ